jgi:hypothetical protein
MRELVEEAAEGTTFLKFWKPDQVAPDLAEHISKLAIPVTPDNRPSLLIHNLGEELDEFDRERLSRISKVISFQFHTWVMYLFGHNVHQ